MYKVLGRVQISGQKLLTQLNLRRVFTKFFVLSVRYNEPPLHLVQVLERLRCLLRLWSLPQRDHSIVSFESAERNSVAFSEIRC